MFGNVDEKFIVEMEIDGVVVSREEYTAPRFERERTMLRRKMERDSRGRPWAIFVIKQRLFNTKYYKPRSRKAA
jgi:hypothetical protein